MVFQQTRFALSGDLNMGRKEEIANELDTISKGVLALYESKKKGDGTYDFNDAELKTVQEAEPKMAALQVELKGINDAERVRQAAEAAKASANAPQRGQMFPGGQPGDGAQAEPWTPRKSIGEAFIASDAFLKYNRAAKSSPEVELEMKSIVIPNAELKTTFDTATSYQPQAIRTGFISEYPTRPIAVINIIPQGTTTQNAVVYMEETTYTNNAAETAESGAYGAAAIAFTERSAPVRKIAVYIPITDELMEDAAQAADYVNNRLGFMVRQRLDSQLIVGDGNAPNLEGILNTSNVQTQALGADSEADAAHKAMTKVQAVGFADPDYHVLHPYNWQKIRLVKTSTGEYIYGAPWEAGRGTLWGLPVLATTAITQGTGLTGAFTPWCQFFTKKDLAVSVGFINDNFINGLQCLRAEIRGAFPKYRPTAFCKYTGLGS
jgi:HK97 family phage major capsid protein